ncbi:hypothetical protein [Ramlibacter sp. AN1133]|uniref:hypothetical protein n=1 Tax=Ramlibacter sp. AN1133 TaxID=3133429 RepID=UPI0030BC985C
MSSPKITWRKSAARDVRPFFGAIALTESLNRAELRLFADGKFSAEPAYLVEPSAAERLALSLRLNFDANVDFGTIHKNDLVIAVTAAQPFLKKTQLVATLPLSKGLPPELEIGDEVLAQLGGGANIDVVVVLCLAKRLEKRPGSPFLLGHWLAKKSFSLRAPQVAEEFDVDPTDDETWAKLGYPPRTLYAVEYLGGMNEPAQKDGKTARVRVHADIFKKLTGESNQKLARPVLGNMAAEIACQMLAASFPDWEGAEEVTQHSPLSAFIKRIEKVQPCDLDGLKKLVREPGQVKLRAILHADQQCVRAIVEA